MILERLAKIYESQDGFETLRFLLLELAVRGKLVSQDLSEGSAAELLTTCQQHREALIKAKKLRRTTGLLPIKSEEKAFEIPPNWSWARLGDIGDWGAGSTPLRGQSKYYDGGTTNWLKSGELNDDANLLGPSEKLITDVALKECSLRLNQPGDVLIAMYGATIGKVALLATFATTNQVSFRLACLAS